MTKKPKNHRALRLTVQYVRSAQVEGGVDAADKLILNCLAQYANADGRGSHPGNVDLMDAVGLKRSAMHVRLEKLISKNLIERTHTGDGRKQASEYRICWENPAYPDVSPNGKERFTEDEKPSGADAETFRPNSGNIPVQSGKHSGADAETFRPNSGNIPVLSRNTSNPPSNQPSQPDQKGGSGWRGFVENLPATMHGAILAGDSEKQIRALVAEHGADFMLATIARWIEPGMREKSVDGLKSKWSVFLKEYLPYLKAVKGETPEAQAVKQRQEDAAIEAAMKEASRIAREQLAEAEANAEESFEEVWEKLKKSAE